MMAIQRYQYGTSPRKLEPEYRQIKTKSPQKSTAPKKKVNKQTIKIRKRDRAKMIASLIVIFSSIFAISYRNSKIDESFTKNEELKQAYLAVEKENDQIKVDIENSLNYTNIEQEAKELLGMQKLSNKHTIYVNLPKKDYIQSATNSVVEDENKSLFEKIVDKIKDIL